MLLGKTILAVVTARSGSKGIENKNMRLLNGITLIGRAGNCLQQLPWLDNKIISTDSEEYIREGERFCLDAPFIRPLELSSDSAGSVETVTHALIESEKLYRTHFDIVLIIEPTSPFRKPIDIYESVKLLIEFGADSVVTVSPLNVKYHPAKVLTINDNHLGFYESRGAKVVTRQSLDQLYWKNGICYALTRDCLLNKKVIFTQNTLPLIIERELVNIDDPIELDWSEFLLKNKYQNQLGE
jgi:CMP-N,N'-diacetyllegionaminic acid synthase